MRGARSGAIGTLVVSLTLAAAPANAAPEHELEVSGTAQRSCLAAADRSTAGVARTSYRAPARGLLTARLDGGAAPDWDLAIFRSGNGRAEAASTSFTSNEQATIAVEAGERLSLQACRLAGEQGAAALSLDLYEIGGPEPAEERISLVSVPLTSPADLTTLEALGLDVTHDVSPTAATIVLYSDDERDRLAAAGFRAETLVGDLVAHDAEVRSRERHRARAVQRSDLPSGRDTYRVYEDYTTEMKQLAEDNPALVRSVLVGETFEGRPIEGIEIATDVGRADDGRPVYLNFGVHHAREWPSGEFPIEFALDLVDGHNAGDPRITSLLDSVRVIVVPVVNVDGFLASRSYGTSPTDDDPNANLPQIIADQAAYKRKNCRPTNNDAAVPCAMRTGSGVDLNRNYGAYWGGPGSSADSTSQSYRGTGPFSEPESQAVREFTSRLHPTVFITNHTFTDDGKWLRQPGFDAEFLPQATVPTYDDTCPANENDMAAISPDEAGMNALGDAMATANGWTSELGYETLCDITGATEDWNYFSQGTYGYTPEARGPNFHGTYMNMVVDEYLGEGGPGGAGVRESFLIAGEFATDPAHHSVIEGTAPAGAGLQLTKSFSTPTCEDSGCAQGDGPAFDDLLDTRLTVPASGQYRWDVNPSGRPLHPDELWTMRCTAAGGTDSRTVAVGRGETASVSFAPDCTALGVGSEPKGQCAGRRATIVDEPGGGKLVGTAGRDVIAAGGGRDRVKSRGGKDVVCGGAGKDRLAGGAGKDRLKGGRGRDTLRGGGGRDRLAGGPGRDRCRGGGGRDKLKSCG